MKKNLYLSTLMVFVVLFTAIGATDRIEDSDPGTVSYDGSLKSYSNADNGTAINLSNDPGQQIVWSYSAPSAGSYDLTFRYTRKASMNPSVDIIVNGSSQSLSLPVTSSGDFSTATLSTSLNSGNNTVILETNADNESGDIDWIEITGDGGTTTQYTISTSANGNGTVSGGGTYDDGSVTSLTATPNSGYQFDNWSGDASGSSNPLSVTVDANKSITANFSQTSGGGCDIVAYQAEDGSYSNGSVDTNHSGYTGSGFVNTDNNTGEWIEIVVDVPNSGDHDFSIFYANGSSDRPVDVAVDGSTEISGLSLSGTGGWSSWSSVDFTLPLSAGTNDIRLTATSSGGAPNVDKVEVCQEEGGGTTTFSLSTSVTGQGSISPSGGTYEEGTVVNLSASATSGWEFDSWSGVDNSSGSSASVTMNSNRSVSATFTEVTASGYIELDADGAGFCAVDGAVETEHSGYTGNGYANTDNSSGTGIDYAADVGSSGTYTIEIRYAATSSRPADLIQNGSSVAGNISLPSTGAWDSWNIVTTTALLSAGSSDFRLEATSGDGLPNIDYLSIEGPGSLTAAGCGGGGDPETYTLAASASPSNGGSISLSPSGGTYDEGTTVTLTASPASGYTFTGWAGDASGSNNSTSVTMDEDKNVTALFSDGTQPPVNDDIVGWATQAGGTTGGAGGITVTCSTGDCIQNAIDARGDETTGPVIIYVNGTITESNTSDNKINVKDANDISIIGVGTSGEFDGIGIKVWRASNVIIQNISVHHVDIGDKDCISIEGPSDHVWVDHCELYAEYQGVDKDYYDGLLDAKGDAEYITYSYNYLHDSWKMMLVGSSDGDEHDRRITIHHNYFDNVNSRMPLFRFGQGHVYNNYYSGVVSTGINSRMGACLKVENNYFEDSHNPIVSAYSDELGAVDESGSIFDNVTWDLSGDTNEPLDCTASIPYSYSSTLNNTADVPSVVVANAGVGQISGSRYAGDVNPTDLLKLSVYPNPAQNKLNIDIPDFTGQETIRVVNLMGVEMMNLKPQSEKADLDISNLASGSYIIQVKTGSYTKLKMFMKK